MAGYNEEMKMWLSDVGVIRKWLWALKRLGLISHAQAVEMYEKTKARSKLP